MHYDEAMNKVFERRQGFRSESTQRRIASVSDRLLEYLLFSGEFKLQARLRERRTLPNSSAPPARATSEAVRSATWTSRVD